MTRELGDARVADLGRQRPHLVHLLVMLEVEVGHYFEFARDLQDVLDVIDRRRRHHRHGDGGDVVTAQRSRPMTEVLPWDHVNVKKGREYLEKEQTRSLTQLEVMANAT